MQANAWEETGAADVGIMGRSHLSRTSAGLSGQTHTLEATAKEDEAGEQLVARLRLERRLLRGITNLAVAVTNDALTGKACNRSNASGPTCCRSKMLSLLQSSNQISGGIKWVPQSRPAADLACISGIHIAEQVRQQCSGEQAL